MSDKEDIVMPVRPLGGLRINSIRQYGYEQPPPEHKPAPKQIADKKKKGEAETADAVCIITPDKVDCKV
jgi:hypothetical protein